MEHEISRFPPILQLVGLALLGAYVLLSVLGRVSDRFEWLWDDPDDVRSLEHIVEYTVVPALMLFAAAVAVVLNWEPGAPLGGGWTVRQLAVGPLTALTGLLLTALAATINRRRGGSAADASRPYAWVPLVAVLLGMGLMVVGILSLGRTLKRPLGGRDRGLRGEFRCPSAPLEASSLSSPHASLELAFADARFAERRAAQPGPAVRRGRP